MEFSSSFLDRRDHVGKILSKGRKVEDAKNPVIVPGAGTVAVTLGNCCTPIPGDEIVVSVRTSGNRLLWNK